MFVQESFVYSLMYRVQYFIEVRACLNKLSKFVWKKQKYGMLERWIHNNIKPQISQLPAGIVCSPSMSPFYLLWWQCLCLLTNSFTILLYPWQHLRDYKLLNTIIKCWVSTFFIVRNKTTMSLYLWIRCTGT